MGDVFVLKYSRQKGKEFHKAFRKKHEMRVWGRGWEKLGNYASGALIRMSLCWNEVGEIHSIMS